MHLNWFFFELEKQHIFAEGSYIVAFESLIQGTMLSADIEVGNSFKINVDLQWKSKQSLKGFNVENVF